MVKTTPSLDNELRDESQVDELLKRHIDVVGDGWWHPNYGYGELKQDLNLLIQKAREEAEIEFHREGYFRAIHDFSGYFMDASMPSQRNPILPDIARDLLKEYHYDRPLVNLPFELKKAKGL